MLGLILYLEEKDQTFQPQSSQEHRRSTRVCRLPAYLNDFRVGGVNYVNNRHNITLCFRYSCRFILSLQNILCS